MPESVLTIRFASYGLVQTLSRGEQSETDLVVSDWFLRGLKLAFFLKKGVFLSTAIHGHPEPSSDGFRGVSEWFQRGFRMVLEGSETVWFQRGFRGV